MEKRFLSFKTRLLIIFFILMVLPLLAVGIISYRYYYQAAWESSLFAANQTIDNLSDEIDKVFAEAAQFLEIDSYTVAENYLAERGDEYDNAKAILAIMNMFRGKRLKAEPVLDIYLVGINGIGISEREGVFKLKNRFSVIPSLKRLRYGNEKSVIFQFNRMENAMRLLKTTSMPAAEISKLVGYKDPQYFSRVFKRTSGLSIRMFRAGS